MPRATKFLKEDIIEAASAVVKKEGLSAINARRVAKELGCWVKPIFYQFENMEDLRQATILHIQKIYQSYMIEGSKEELAYRGMGLAYIRFAKDYPDFFKILFMGDSKISPTEFIEKDNMGNQILEKGAEFTGYDRTEQEAFHLKVWIFTHGIASMVATGTVAFTDEQIEELNDRLKRQMAEFENFRKRTDKEKQAMFDTGAKSVIEKILPVVDNFERGLATVPEESKEDPFVDGMNRIYKQLMTELENIGVKPIEAVGQEFDPNLHNAVMQVESDEYESGVVAQELQKGYTYHDMVVRHSMVGVVQ